MAYDFGVRPTNEEGAIYIVNLRIPNAGENCGSSVSCGAIRKASLLLERIYSKFLKGIIPSGKEKTQKNKKKEE